MRIARPWRLGVLVFFAARVALGQAVVDNIPDARGSGTVSSAKREAAASRYTLGPVHFLPVLGLGGIGYNNNIAGSNDIQNQRGDVTASAHGGVRAVAPIGTRTFIRGYAGLTYGWFLRETKRRHLGFTYDAGVGTTFGRVTLDVAAASSQAVTQVSTELDSPVFQRNVSLRSRADVDLMERLGVFLTAGLLQPRYDSGGLDPAAAAGVSALERTDSYYGVGLRYKFGAHLDAAGQIQKTRLRFKNVPDRDADGTGYVGSIGYEGRRLYVVVNAGYREYKSTLRGVSTERNGIFGGIRFDYDLLRTKVSLYGNRQRNESIFTDSTFFVETLGGLSLRRTLGRRALLSLTGFVEVGTSSYDRPVIVDGASVERIDDILRVGGSVSLPVTRFFHINLAASRAQYTSNVPGADRRIWQITTGINYVPSLTGAAP